MAQIPVADRAVVSPAVFMKGSTDGPQNEEEQKKG